jgi:multidrug efflux pump subunit AcrA (membrane-fusion protein)
MGEWDEITQIRGRTASGAAHVLLADGDAAVRRWFREAVAGELDLDEVDSGETALDWIAAGVPRLVVVGRQLTDMTGAGLLERASQWLGEKNAPIGTFLLADASGASAEVDESRIRVFYRLVPTMQATRVRELLAQASSRLPPGPPVDRDPPPEIAAIAKRIGEEGELSGAAKVAAAAAQELVGADRVRCLFCDEDTGALWAEGEEEHEAQASVGLAGFAVRTITTVAVPHAAADALFLKSLDDPQGSGRERLLVQPVAGLDGHVHAVLIAIRHESKAPFGAVEIAAIEALATAWAPYVEQLAMRIEADNILGDRLEQGPSDMFRNEAIMHLVRRGARGDVVRVHPGWVRAAYWLVLASLAGAIAFAAIAHVHQYAEGPAVVQFGYEAISAHEGGTISILDVDVGQHVKLGDPIAHLYDAEQASRLRRAENDFEDKLVNYLQDPSVGPMLAQARSELDAANQAVESRTIHAPCDGTIQDISVHEGQRIDGGKVVGLIAKAGATRGNWIYVFLPAGEAPRVELHQELTFTLPGYRGARFASEIVWKDGSTRTAADARSMYLGERLGDVPMAANVLVVKAQLDRTSFVVDGTTYDLRDGTIGVAEIQLESHSVLATVIPGLQR